MKTRVVVLGAGFGGLELSTLLSEALGDGVDVTLIDKNDSFVFGYSKLDVMFGRTTPEAVRLPYRDIAKPGVRFLQEVITAIDPQARRVTTDGGVHEADILVAGAGRRLRHGRDAGTRGGGQRVLLGGRRRTAGRAAPHVLAGPRDRRRVGRRSSALRRRARRRCCCTTTSPRAASARTARSPS